MKTDCSAAVTSSGRAGGLMLDNNSHLDLKNLSATLPAYRMTYLDEVLGNLHHIEEVDGGCIALIGKIYVLLPSEMAEKLQGSVGRRIGILYLDGYKLRVF